MRDGKVPQYVETFDRLICRLSKRWAIEWSRKTHTSRRAEFCISAGEVVFRTHAGNENGKQDVKVNLNTTAGKVLLCCSSVVGEIPTDDQETIEALFREHRRYGHAKLSATNSNGTLTIRAERNILFHPNTTQEEEMARAVLTAARCAAHLRRSLFTLPEEAYAAHS
jgi:hypothetical protein